VLAEGNTVVTRRWTWRQANHTLTAFSTRAVEYNVDGLPPMSAGEVGEACAEISALVRRFCGGRLRCELLTTGDPEIRLGD
jgi:DNA/RNA-binding domain of Phe-tRNA-synthetase-like protein